MTWFITGLRYEAIRLAKNHKCGNAKYRGLGISQKALSLLTPQPQKAITAAILEGRPENEAAIRLGMSQPAVH
jgi:predicted DNA-binding protein (UPF0251 family)